MRLDVAVSVVAHTLPLVGEASASLMASVNHRKKRQGLGHHPSNAPRANHHDEAKPQTRNVKRNVMETKSKCATVQAAAKAEEKHVHAKSQDKTSKESPTECNPRSNDPDIGIFSCGMDNHCIQDDDSGLGGFCVAYPEAASAMRRSLQDGGLCDDLYLDCDCSKFENGVGTYLCVSSECVDDEGEICGKKEDVVVVNDDGSYRTSSCFVDTDGSPIQSYCYSTMFDGVQKTGCELVYNENVCNSCSHVICSDEFGGGEGLEFDCSNLSSDSTAKGTTCDGGEWRDFFLNPSGESTPTMAEPTSESTPSPDEPKSGSTPPPNEPTSESTPPPNEPPAPDLPTSPANSLESSMTPPSAEPTAVSTSNGVRLVTRAPLVMSIVVAVGFGLLAASSVSIAFE